MVPPPDRPTFQAVSSATPNSSILGLAVSITSMASVTTAPSTQPPDTEPRKLPSLSMTRLDPTGRGAEPHVSTTVASATSRPSRRQSSAALRMSSSRASMSQSPVFRYVKENIETAAREANGFGQAAVARMERSVLQERRRHIVRAVPDYAALHPGYGPIAYFTSSGSAPLGLPAAARAIFSALASARRRQGRRRPLTTFPRSEI